ncbi:MarR family transcriptional regulator [Mesorhizobium sp. L-8-10]|uniref:MarR family winged helix-turn-helix transcriptional regulator n=1 Tax=unclassified Mesorhizobium TaxID=325217 RepID=UPI001926104C|nr:MULTISPECIES: MarR family transcriptional regulator [unclassified Mesorhizobium]BCH21815.1 MarR family transcriptional regulator [Mesorhizobium sp. L-8-3]BCH29504.1 MarR family transcriptional regulator [Mesorhizobium sp. L-8-10]
MPQRIDPDSFGFLVTDVQRLVRAELDRRIGEAGLGLTPGEGRTLSHAARAGAVRQTVLAERMGVEAMTLSTALDRLEAHGLIERQPDPADRRAKQVHVTESGQDMLARIQPIAAGMRADASKGVAQADWQRFLDTLKIVRANLTEARLEGARRESAAA